MIYSLFQVAYFLDPITYDTCTCMQYYCKAIEIIKTKVVRKRPTGSGFITAITLVWLF